MYMRLLITYPYIHVPLPHTPTHFLVHTILYTERDIKTQSNPIVSVTFFLDRLNTTPQVKKTVDITTLKNFDENHGKNGMSPTAIALIIIAVILSVVIITVAIVVIYPKLRQKRPVFGKTHGKTSY